MMAAAAIIFGYFNGKLHVRVVWLPHCITGDYTPFPIDRKEARYEILILLAHGSYHGEPV